MSVKEKSKTSLIGQSAQRLILNALLLAVAYLFLAQFNWQFAGRFSWQAVAPPSQPGPLWLPASLALASLYLWGIRLWPGVWLGAFLFRLMHEQPILEALGVSSGSVLEALLALWLLQRLSKRPNPFATVRSLAGYFCAIGSGALVAATFQVIFNPPAVLDGLALAQRWWEWWLSDLTSLLLAAPVILVWWNEMRLGWVRSRCIEVTLMLLVSLIMILAIFGNWLPNDMTQPLPYLTLVLLGWSAARFRQREVITSAAVIAAIVIGATLSADSQGQGPFSLNPGHALLQLQIYLATLAITSLVMGAIANERREAWKAFQRLNRELEYHIQERTNSLEQSRAGLRENENLLQAIIDAAPFGAHSYERDRNNQLVFIGYNRAADQILGVDHRAYIGKTIEQAFPALANTPIPDIYRRIAAGGESYEDEQVSYNEGQIQGAFDIHAFQTGANRMTVFFRDITERKKADEQIRRINDELEQRVNERTVMLEASTRELEAFSYAVSHDLRAPLRALNGFSYILLHDHAAQLPPEARRYLDVIRQNAQYMGQLIDDLLNFVSMGRQPLTIQQVNMTSLANQAVDCFRLEIEGRQIQVQMGALPNCSGDPDLIYQVWFNLISNAVKFTRQRVTARIEIGCIESPGEQTYFVRDNGIGFDMKYVNKLFGVFQRLHRVEDYEGTGVGLAMVQRIIRRHHGRIWAESAPEQGATLFFSLPRTPIKEV